MTPDLRCWRSFDLKWVMAQVGHADSRMTMDFYAQLDSPSNHGNALVCPPLRRR